MSDNVKYAVLVVMLMVMFWVGYAAARLQQRYAKPDQSPQQDEDW